MRPATFLQRDDQQTQTRGPTARHQQPLAARRKLALRYQRHQRPVSQRLSARSCGNQWHKRLTSAAAAATELVLSSGGGKGGRPLSSFSVLPLTCGAPELGSVASRGSPAPSPGPAVHPDAPSSEAAAVTPSSEFGDGGLAKRTLPQEAVAQEGAARSRVRRGVLPRRARPRSTAIQRPRTAATKVRIKRRSSTTRSPKRGHNGEQLFCSCCHRSSSAAAHICARHRSSRARQTCSCHSAHSLELGETRASAAC